MKPQNTPERQSWLRGLREGQEVVVWHNLFGWREARVTARTNRRVYFETRTTIDVGTPYVPIFSGWREYRGAIRCMCGIYPTDDPIALKGLRLDRFRQTLQRKDWAGVSDEVVEKIENLFWVPFPKETLQNNR